MVTFYFLRASSYVAQVPKPVGGLAIISGSFVRLEVLLFIYADLSFPVRYMCASHALTDAVGLILIPLLLLKISNQSKGTPMTDSNW